MQGTGDQSGVARKCPDEPSHISTAGGTLSARFGVIDRSVERSACARRCRRTEARERSVGHPRPAAGSERIGVLSIAGLGSCLGRASRLDRNRAWPRQPRHAPPGGHDGQSARLGSDRTGVNDRTGGVGRETPARGPAHRTTVGNRHVPMFLVRITGGAPKPIASRFGSPAARLPLRTRRERCRAGRPEGDGRAETGPLGPGPGWTGSGIGGCHRPGHRVVVGTVAG
jgi:hypothetical protein